MPAKRIVAVLDRSALQSFSRGHVHVGEMLKEVAHEKDAVVAIPAVALLEARAGAVLDKSAFSLLEYITTLPTVALLPLDRDEALGAESAVLASVGDLARAHAIWAAMAHRVSCYTTEPERFPALMLRNQIVAIPAEDV
jgi:hypothetical protein